MHGFMQQWQLATAFALALSPRCASLQQLPSLVGARLSLLRASLFPAARCSCLLSLLPPLRTLGCLRQLRPSLPNSCTLETSDCCKLVKPVAWRLWAT